MAQEPLPLLVADGCYETLELGAGRGRCGTKFFAPCVETDKERYPRDIDLVTDATKLSIGGQRFDRVLICNPYPFGFKGAPGTQLMAEVLRVLRRPGEVLLVTNSTNPYCQPDRVERIVSALGASVAIEVSSINPDEVFPKHSFKKLDGSLTRPDLQITLRV